MKFRDWFALLPPPYLVYWDTETMFSNLKDGPRTIGEQTSLVNELKPLKAAYHIHFSDREIIEEDSELREMENIKIFTGIDCLENFFIQLREDLYFIHSKIRIVRPVRMSDEIWKRYKDEKKCGICSQFYSNDWDYKEKGLKSENLRKVVHHSHLSGNIFINLGNY